MVLTAFSSVAALDLDGNSDYFGVWHCEFPDNIAHLLRQEGKAFEFVTGALWSDTIGFSEFQLGLRKNRCWFRDLRGVLAGGLAFSSVKEDVFAALDLSLRSHLLYCCRSESNNSKARTR